MQNSEEVINYIHNKFQTHTDDMRSRCCKSEFHFDDNSEFDEVCDKCGRLCEVDWMEVPTKMPIQLPISRNGMAELFNELGYKTGAEIGIERGLFSEVLCKAITGLSLKCVDPLQVYQGYREHVSQDKMDSFYIEASERLSPFNCEIIRKYSLDAVGQFTDDSLDFVYIDANHDFQNTTNDIAEWSKKVKVGGIVAGHDYTRNKKKDYRCHVKDVVQGWTYAHGIRPYFITSDKSPSWFWVRQ